MEPREVVRRFVDEYQTGADERAFDAFMHPDVIDHSRPPGISPGADGVRQQFDGFRAAFEDFHATMLDQIAEGDKVVTRKVFHGGHTGEFQGIEPTGREVEIHVTDIVRVHDRSSSTGTASTVSDCWRNSACHRAPRPPLRSPPSGLHRGAAAGGFSSRERGNPLGPRSRVHAVHARSPDHQTSR